MATKKHQLLTKNINIFKLLRILYIKSFLAIFKLLSLPNRILIEMESVFEHLVIYPSFLKLFVTCTRVICDWTLSVVFSYIKLQTNTNYSIDRDLKTYAALKGDWKYNVDITPTNDELFFHKILHCSNCGINVDG